MDLIATIETFGIFESYKPTTDTAYGIIKYFYKDGSNIIKYKNGKIKETLLLTDSNQSDRL